MYARLTSLCPRQLLKLCLLMSYFLPNFSVFSMGENFHKYKNCMFSLCTEKCMFLKSSMMFLCVQRLLSSVLGFDFIGADNLEIACKKANKEERKQLEVCSNSVLKRELPHEWLPQKNCHPSQGGASKGSRDACWKEPSHSCFSPEKLFPPGW